VTLKKFTEKLHARMLYLYPDGYLMVSEAGEGGELKLSARNGSLPKKDLLAFFVQGLITPTPDIPESAMLRTPEAQKPEVESAPRVETHGVQSLTAELPPTQPIRQVQRRQSGPPEQAAPVQAPQPQQPPPSQPVRQASPQQTGSQVQSKVSQPEQPPSAEDISADSTVLYSKPVSKATLLVLEGAGVGTGLEVHSGSVLGRDSSADLVIQDPRISRRHALFGCGLDGVWIVKDLESSNGTLVNGEKVESKALSDGDTIRLGDTTLKFNA